MFLITFVTNEKIIVLVKTNVFAHAGCEPYKPMLWKSRFLYYLGLKYNKVQYLTMQVFVLCSHYRPQTFSAKNAT